ncbi:MAG TPA: hypothetical protein DEH78_17165, partial [Solibacterales bacterium]|nr:hypothetical protein [Bryobacterales bacterium]
NRMEDPAISNPALRRSFRDQHAAGLEDGLRALAKALSLDANYSDALAYANLIHRMKAGMAETAEEATKEIALADGLVLQALAAKRREGATNPQPPQPLDVSAPPPGPARGAPPPPPPPPPPGRGMQTASELPPPPG